MSWAKKEIIAKVTRVPIRRSVRSTWNSHGARLNHFTQDFCPQIFFCSTFIVNVLFFIQCNLGHGYLGGTQLVKLGSEA